MRVGVIQSCYAPWRGYFDFVGSVDLFIIYDDVQYSKGSWRNRSRIKSPRGPRWLTVPVHVNLGMRIEEVLVAYDSRPWQNEHSEALTNAFETAKYGSDALELWHHAIGYRDPMLTALNERLLRGVCRYLNIRTPIARSSEYPVSGAKTDRLLALLKLVGASTYLSGPSAKAYLEENRFSDAGIALEYKSYSYPEYPQSWGPFVDGLSIIDLIAHCGPESKSYMRSTVPDVVAVR